MERVDPVAAVREAQASSEILRELERSLAIAAGGEPLTDGHVARLEAAGNSSVDWSRVRAAAGFDPAFVRGSHFEGDCYLGVFGEAVEVAPGVELPSGVYGSTLVSSAVETGALVRDARLVARASVGEGAVVMDVGELVALVDGRFAVGEALPLGIESGGREVALYPEITVPVAERIALERAEEKLQREYRAAVQAYARRLASGRALVCRRARVAHTPFLRGVYVGEDAVVDSAAGIEDAAILSAEGEPARVSTGAVVERSALLESAHAAMGAKVVDSILGPCSVIEKGEATSALVGPLAAQHHYSLLIAATWPGGRGNVAAGALVGSNHTGRTGDQEIRIGEGVFFGLGTRIKFPADFSRAPYTIIVSGPPLPPQRIEFPFSLVRPARPGLAAEARSRLRGPVTHEILPGWALAESAYTVARTARKHRDRYRAKRTPIDQDPLRPEMLALVKGARERLVRAGEDARETYAGPEIPGLGSCVMTELGRRRAVDAYTSTLFRRALLELWARVRRCASGGDVERALAVEDSDGAWAFHRATLLEERPGAPLRSLLAELIDAQEDFARAVESSKAKDDARGERVIDDYAGTRASAAEDEHVLKTWEETRALREEVSRFLDGPACPAEAAWDSGEIGRAAGRRPRLRAGGERTATRGMEGDG